MTALQYLRLPGVENPDHATDEQLEEANRVLQEIFVRVFRGEEARIVLGVLLEDLHVFRTATTPEEMALKNYGTALIRDRLGVTLNLKTLDALLGRAEEQ